MAVSKAKPSHIYSSISVAIVMFLLGIFVLILLHSHNLTNIIKEKMNIVAELSDDANQENVVKLIKSQPEVRQSTVQFITKESAAERMGSTLNRKFTTAQNPFQNVAIFNVRADKYDIETIQSIKEKLEKNTDVQGVYYEDVTINNIRSNLNKLAYAILSIGLIFVFLAIVIIRNTINLTMYADRWEIKTMELIGAKWNFIKMPYIKTSVLVGIKAFLIASVSILAILVFINLQIPQVWDVINIFYIIVALAVIFVLSIIIPALTTNTAANKYLSTSIDSLYD